MPARALLCRRSPEAFIPPSCGRAPAASFPTQKEELNGLETSWPEYTYAYIYIYIYM